MDTLTAITDLGKSLATANSKSARVAIIDMMDKLYKREVRDESVSKIKELEDKISALNIKFLNGG